MRERQHTNRSATRSPALVAFLGDSITAAGRWQEWFPGVEAINFGVNGDTTDDVLERLGSVIDAQPDQISLLIGANDFGRQHSVEHVVRNIQLMLVELRRSLPRTRTLVQSIMPRSRGFAQHINEANIHLRQFAPTVHAQYLDLWPALATGTQDVDASAPSGGELKSEFSDDQLHLNDAGYQAWLAELRPALDHLAELPPMNQPTELVN